MEKETLFRWEEIELFCVLRVLLRKAWMILLAALIGVMGASVLLTVVLTESYTSSVTFAVTARSGSYSSYTNINAATEVAAVYSELLQSSMMSETIREALGGVSGTITAQQLGQTNLVRVTVEASTPKAALLVVRALVDNQRQLSDYISSMSVLTPLNAPSVTIAVTHSYSRGRVCALAGLLCAFAMVVALFLISAAGSTVQNRTAAKNNLDAKMLAAIPHERGPKLRLRGRRKPTRTQVSIASPVISFSFAESIHQIATRFEHEKSKGHSVFLFSSVSVAEGKSTIAANVALSLAASSPKVLLIDLDLRRPVQHQILDVVVSTHSELDKLLSAGASAETILDAVITKPNSALSLLLPAKGSTKLVELLSSRLLSEVIALARERYDYVIIDSPPLGCFSDSEILSDLTDASVLVVRQDVSAAAEINDAIDSLRAGKSVFLGYVLNDMRRLLPGSSFYGYGYGYGGRYYGKYGKYSKYGYGISKEQQAGKTKS